MAEHMTNRDDAPLIREKEGYQETEAFIRVVREHPYSDKQCKYT